MSTTQRIGDCAFGMLLGACLGFWPGMMVGAAYADDSETVAPAEVAIVANQVVETLRFQGFDVQVGDLPPAHIVRIDGRNTAETPGSSVRINDRMPEACRTRLLAHELTHIFIDRRYGAIADGEAIARAVESIVVPDYQPGCDRKQVARLLGQADTVLSELRRVLGVG